MYVDSGNSSGFSQVSTWMLSPTIIIISSKFSSVQNLNISCVYLPMLMCSLFEGGSLNSLKFDGLIIYGLAQKAIII